MPMRNRDVLRYRRPPAANEEAGPSVLTILIGINCLAFFIRLLFAVPVGDDVAPAGFISHQQLQQANWWTVFTHLFVHRDILHLGSNLVLLWLVGRSVLDKLGPMNFTYLYFLGGWTGTALELFAGVQRADAQIIGASGSVFAVLTAFAVLNPDYSLTERFRRWIGFRLRARTVIFCTLFAECLLSGLQYLPQAASLFMGIATSHLCHVGGGFFGLLFALHTRPLPSIPYHPRRRPVNFHNEFASDEDLYPYVPVHQSLRTRKEDEQEILSFPASPPEPVSDQEFIQLNVNPILEKLHDHGLDSLTPDERKTLHEASQRLGK